MSHVLDEAERVIASHSQRMFFRQHGPTLLPLIAICYLAAHLLVWGMRGHHFEDDAALRDRIALHMLLEGAK